MPDETRGDVDEFLVEYISIDLLGEPQLPAPRAHHFCLCCQGLIEVTPRVAIGFVSTMQDQQIKRIGQKRIQGQPVRCDDVRQHREFCLAIRCAHEGVLTHCRGESSHVRGCLIVDLILGKS